MHAHHLSLLKSFLDKINTHVHETIKTTLYELVFGQPLYSVIVPDSTIGGVVDETAVQPDNGFSHDAHLLDDEKLGEVTYCSHLEDMESKHKDEVSEVLLHTSLTSNMKLAFVSQRDSASEYDMLRHDSLSELPCKQTDNFKDLFNLDHHLNNKLSAIYCQCVQLLALATSEPFEEACCRSHAVS